MVRKIIIVVLLLGAGVAIAMYLHGGPAPKPVETFTPRTGASDADRIADLERALAAEVERGHALETRLGELEGRLGQRFGANRGGAEGATEDRRNARAQFGNGNFDPAAMLEQRRQRQIDRLVAAGFTADRAEWINRRTQELELQQQQAQADAQRNGTPFRRVDTETALRKDMGDAEYEKYLSALGQPTNVRVMDVLATSAAEKSGLKAGDQIVSYAGTRVFDNDDLTTLTRQGTPGETVTVEVQRDGQTVQVQVPRGVLGVQGAGGRGPGGFPGGGFRGGPGGAAPGG
ncbi:MAG: PDZ domain-containing protein [Pseudomonadota bacterium]